MNSDEQNCQPLLAALLGWDISFCLLLLLPSNTYKVFGFDIIPSVFETSHNIKEFIKSIIGIQQ